MSAVLRTTRLVLDGRGGAQERALQDADADGLQWIQLDWNDADATRWLEQESGVPETATEAMLALTTRPRCQEYENGVLLIVRGVNLNRGAEADDMIALRVWLARDRIVTCLRRPLKSVRAVEERLAAGHGPTTPNELLIQLIEELAERIDAALDEMAEELEQAEDSIESAQSAIARRGLVALRRRTARMRRFLFPQREALERLCRLTGPYLTLEQVRDVQLAIDAQTRHIEDLDLARERAVLVHDELQNRIAQQQNTRVYVLSIVTAIFLPLSFLTGLLGINVGGIPGAESEIAFWLVCAGAVGVALLLGVVFRMLRWL